MRAHVIAAALIAAACVPPPGDAPSGDDIGGIEVALTVTPGLTLASLSYMITSPAGFSRAGTLDVSHSATATALISSLPAGTGFSIALQGTSTDGSAQCAGSAPFMVVAHATTSVAVRLGCHQGARTGTAIIKGAVNVCPFVDAVTADHSQAPVGTAVALSATAHDIDAAPSPLTYAWTTEGGMLSDATLHNPTLTCTAAGVFDLTVTVSDGDCTDTGKLTVACVPE